MARDLRSLFEEERKKNKPSLAEGHEDRFLRKMEKAFPEKRKKWIIPFWLRSAAAAVLCLIAVWCAYAAWNNTQTVASENTNIVDSAISPNESLKGKTKEEKINNPVAEKEKTPLSLSDISPDLKKVETYFISSINVELANLKVEPEEQEMVDAYLEKVNELGDEYERLNKELNTIGVNDMTITALIENLKLRLQLLQRLKKNINHLKNKNHDKASSSSI